MTKLLISLGICSLIMGTFQYSAAAQNSTALEATVQSSLRPVRALYVAGKVSRDGKAFSMGEDGEDVWLVANPRALHGLEGRRISAKCYLDLEKNLIHVLSVKADSSQVFLSRHDDAAFRR